MMNAEAFKKKGFDRLNEFLKSPNDGSFYVGHACVLARVSGHLFIVDAVKPRALFLESWLFFPDLILNKELLDRVDGVFISHCHEDHYDPPFLRTLKKGTPIYITQGRVGLEEIINDSSLNVIQIPPMKLFPIAEGVEVLALPSDHNDFDSSFIIKGKNFSVFQGNDNFLDDKTVLQAREIAGKVHHAYIPFAYIWWYPFCLTSMTPQQRQEEIRRLSYKNMRIGAMMGEVFESDLIVPSAANLVYFESADSALNKEAANGFDFTNYVSEEHKDLKNKTKPLFGGDYALQTSAGVQVSSQELNREQYFEILGQFLKEINAIRPKAPERKSIEEEELSALKKRIASLPEQKFDIKLYFRRPDLSDWLVELPLNTYTPQVVRHVPADTARVVFDIQAHAFEMWLNGEINMETILNSQRFLVYRNPEEFNPDLWNMIRTRL